MPKPLQGVVNLDFGDSASQEYTPHVPFSGGRIVKVQVKIRDDAYLNLEREFAAAIARA
jgi:hypothetical protein